MHDEYAIAEPDAQIPYAASYWRHIASGLVSAHGAEIKQHANIAFHKYTCITIKYLYTVTVPHTSFFYHLYNFPPRF